MTAAEAHAAAAAEGLSLVPAENPTGFKYVEHSPLSRKQFRARPFRDGRQHDLGRFATAEEAALAVARFFGPQ